MSRPSATYRLQFTPKFSFEAAEQIIPYLADLGVSDIYASPVFKAVKGSTHGYDVVDPTEINAELGGLDGLRRITATARAHNLGWLQDIVPNHMAFDSENLMLMDILENGQCSPWFRFFDIEWDHYHEGLRGRLLAPFLGQLYSEALENGEISLRYDDRGITINYYELSFPLRIESYVAVLTHNLDALEQSLGEHDTNFIKFLGTLYTINGLPGPDHIPERYEQIRFIKRLLRELYAGNEHIRKFVDNNLAAYNGNPGDRESFNLMDRLLSEQHFRLSFWKVATEEINYRRFFSINSLISLRLEDRHVFDETHRLIADLVADGTFTGLRVDHIDGLNDPARYLGWLREAAPEAYLVVEKILEPDETAPPDWPIDGTSGYDFMNIVGGVFVDSAAERDFTRLYQRFAKMQVSYERLVAEKKRLIITKHLAGNIDDLAHLMKRISSNDRYGNDITLYGLRSALIEVATYFPVYRTYITADHFRDSDRELIHRAVARAIDHNPDLINELHFIEKFLMLRTSDMTSDEEREQTVQFAMRFQQLTGPLMAKGFEDTTLYVYNRLLALNEVGSSPNLFGRSLEQFHEFSRRRREHHPGALNALGTHDHKRGEDARARLAVLSEIPHEWEAAIAEWRRINKRKKIVRGMRVPDKNDEYFLYQTLLGAWPSDGSPDEHFAGRIRDYVIKAVREAKVHTAWLKPDSDYEDAYLAFVDYILRPDEANAFMEPFRAFAHRVTSFGMLNSLGQTLLRITAPGVPDFYQGSEFWDISLVDPDNRRPVDFAARRETLDAIRQQLTENRSAALEGLLDSMSDGRIKLFLIHAALIFRRDNRSLFDNGDYLPLAVHGIRSDNVVAFARRYDNQWAVTIVPRFTTQLVSEGNYPLGEHVWGDTAVVLPDQAPGSWRNVLTSEPLSGKGRLAVAAALNRFPVALVTNTEEL